MGTADGVHKGVNLVYSQGPAVSQNELPQNSAYGVKNAKQFSEVLLNLVLSAQRKEQNKHWLNQHCPNDAPSDDFT